MRKLENQTKLIAAAVISVAGAAWSAQIYASPPRVSGPDPAQIRALADRLPELERQVRAPAPVLSLDDPGPAPHQATARVQPTTAVSAPRRPSAIPAPSGAPEREPRRLADAAAPAPLPNPVQNIALMGVTHRGGKDRVWLVDLNSSAREVASEGEAAFGLQVQDIRPESVLLAQNGDEYELRLGQKQIPPLHHEAEVASAPKSTPAAVTGVAVVTRQARRAARRAWRAANRAGGPSRPQARNSGSRRSRGPAGGNRNYSRGSVPNWAMRQARRGAFGGVPEATSNPQTARRVGARLIGGAEPLPQPPAIQNPQTLRRLGSSNNRAFGQYGNASPQRRVR